MPANGPQQTRCGAMYTVASPRPSEMLGRIFNSAGSFYARRKAFRKASRAERRHAAGQLQHTHEREQQDDEHEHDVDQHAIGEPRADE